MGLSKLLILGLVVWVGFVLWRRYKGFIEPSRPQPPARRMVQCRECGVYLPEGDALHGAEGFACRSHENSGQRG